MSHYPDPVELEKLRVDIAAAPNMDAYFWSPGKVLAAETGWSEATVIDTEGEVVCTCVDDATARLLVRALNALTDLLHVRTKR